MYLVYRAGARHYGFADVVAFAPNGTLEETGAAIAREHAVVFTGGVVLAHAARDIVQDATWPRNHW